MASKLTIDSLGDAVARALGQRLVALLLYGSAARGTNVRDRSDINTLLICDAADDALFDALAPVVREWTRARHPAPLILTEREWRESADAFPIEYEDMRDAHRGRGSACGAMTCAASSSTSCSVSSCGCARHTVRCGASRNVSRA